MNTKPERTPYISFVLEGLANYAFIHGPRPKDLLYDKPPMFVCELYDFKVVAQPGSPIKDEKDLKTYRITTRTFDLPVDHKDYERLDGKKVVKFQTKVYGDTDEEIEANTEKRRPAVTDKTGETISSSVLVGNGSRVRIKGSLPDYTKVTPPAGRKPVTPTLDAVMVLDLVEYVRPEGSPEFVSKRNAPLAPIEDTDILDDPFAALEQVEDLEPAPKVVVTKKRRT